MKIPKEEGRYKAVPSSWTVRESKKNLPEFACTFSITEINDPRDGLWYSVIDQGFEISWYANLIYNDRETGRPIPNKINVDQCRLLGWSGASLADLNDGDWSAAEVQLSIGLEEYNGKSSMRVQYVNPIDYEPGFKKSAPQAVQALDAKFGTMLRALAPAASAKAPAKPADRPAPAPAKGKLAAWNAFVAKWTPYVKENPQDAALRDERWKELVEELFPAREPKDIAADEWESVVERIASEYVPSMASMCPI